jgi:hypothetical protein
MQVGSLRRGSDDGSESPGDGHGDGSTQNEWEHGEGEDEKHREEVTRSRPCTGDRTIARIKRPEPTLKAAAKDPDACHGSVNASGSVHSSASASAAKALCRVSSSGSCRAVPGLAPLVTEEAGSWSSSSARDCAPRRPARRQLRRWVCPSPAPLRSAARPLHASRPHHGRPDWSIAPPPFPKEWSGPRWPEPPRPDLPARRRTHQEHQ